MQRRLRQMMKRHLDLIAEFELIAQRREFRKFRNEWLDQRPLDHKIHLVLPSASPRSAEVGHESIGNSHGRSLGDREERLNARSLRRDHTRQDLTPCLPRRWPESDGWVRSITTPGHQRPQSLAGVRSRTGSAAIVRQDRRTQVSSNRHAARRDRLQIPCGTREAVRRCRRPASQRRGL